MRNEIGKDDILAFQEKYRENEQNIKIERKIKKLGIMNLVKILIEKKS